MPSSSSLWWAPNPWSNTSTSSPVSTTYPEHMRRSDGVGVPVPSSLMRMSISPSPREVCNAPSRREAWRRSICAPSRFQVRDRSDLDEKLPPHEVRADTEARGRIDRKIFLVDRIHRPVVVERRQHDVVVGYVGERAACLLEDRFDELEHVPRLRGTIAGA